MQLSSNGAPDAALLEIRKAIQFAEELRNRDRPGFPDCLPKSSPKRHTQLPTRAESHSRRRLDGAFESYRKALAVDEPMLRIDPASEVARNAIEIDYVHLGRALGTKGDVTGALVNQRKALEIARELAAGSASATRKRDVAVACNAIAACYEDLGDLKQALASYREGRAGRYTSSWRPPIRQMRPRNGVSPSRM
jgi:tetratricopeptide (TPR) repeat protein